MLHKTLMDGIHSCKRNALCIIMENIYLDSICPALPSGGQHLGSI